MKKSSVYNLNTTSTIKKPFSAHVEGYRHFAKLQPTENLLLLMLFKCSAIPNFNTFC